MSKAKILRNLEGRTYPVAEHCAMNGVMDAEGYAALKELITDGKVEKTMISGPTDKFGRGSQLPVYRAIREFGSSHGPLTLVQ